MKTKVSASPHPSVPAKISTGLGILSFPFPVFFKGEDVVGSGFWILMEEEGRAAWSEGHSPALGGCT